MLNIEIQDPNIITETVSTYGYVLFASGCRKEQAYLLCKISKVIKHIQQCLQIQILLRKHEHKVAALIVQPKPNCSPDTKSFYQSAF